MVRLFLALLLFPSVLLSAPSNLILITIDTLRADYLGSYGNKTVKTPNLDALASRAMLFENAFCTAPLTLPSHTSLMTGRYPVHHGVRDNAGSVNFAELTLAEVLKQSGYHTYAVVGGFPLDHRFGLNQGFEQYDDTFPRQKNVSLGFRAERPADAVVQAVQRIKLQEPYFLWVHFYDPHAPYMNGGYAGEIGFVDTQVGILLQKLRAENAFVAVAGDHGESLGEHGEWTHRIFIYDSTMHVPFWMSGPGIAPQRIQAQARLIDFFPTILSLLKITVPSGIDGSVLPQKAGSNALLESFFPRFQLGWSPLVGIRTPEWKYIEAPKPELYDLKSDRSEKQNVVAKHPDIVKRLRAQLPRLEPPSRPSAISPEAAEELAALGYVSGSSGSKARHIDAKDQIHVWNQIERAVDLENTKPAETIAILEQARKWDPDNPMVLGFLAQKYAEANRLPEAKKILSAVIAHEPENTLALHRMAVVCLQSGQPAEAIKWAETLQKLDKSNADAWILLARAHIKLGEIPRAIQSLTTALKIDPLDVDLRVDLGNLFIQNNQTGEARKQFEQAVKGDSQNLQALNGLGTCFFLLADYASSETYLKKALNVNAGDVQTKLNLALLYSQTNRRADAVRLYREVAESPTAPADWKKEAAARLAELE